jgi:glycosyltransferase involved in cell wall biosynthesis
MKQGGVLYDVSEFLAHPLRTGIQRLMFEVLHGTLRDRSLHLRPVRVGPDGEMVSLPPETVTWMREFFGTIPGNPPRAAERLRALAQAGQCLFRHDLERAEAILNAEVFFDAARIEFYLQLTRTSLRDRLFFVVCDLLPWLHPEWFSQGAVLGTMPYLRLLRQIPHLAFISEQTRTDFLERVARPGRFAATRLRSELVLALGADGLGRAEPCFCPESRQFSVLGTLEPRKNHRSVLDAFERLWAEGIRVRLVFAGRLGWLEEEDRNRIERLRAEQSLFEWRSDLCDDEVVEVIRSSRATIYPSWGEGFGLPPLESLALGVPVIVSADIPSTSMVEPLGQVRLARPDAASIEEAVRQMLRADFARARHEEIRGLRLPRWSDLGGVVSGWVRQAVQAAPASETWRPRAAA